MRDRILLKVYFPAQFLRFAAVAFSFHQFSFRAPGAFGALTAGFGNIGQPGLAQYLLSPLKFIEQPLHGQFPVGDLRTGITCHHPQTAGFVQQGYCCRNLIYILTTWP
ncbi:MAG: hypothetical protein WCE49_11195 [Terrimicrobiaceae bacterium]